MSWFTTLRLAVRAMWRNLVRTVLTMLGIVCGIAAVIAMVSLGRGAQQSVRDVFTGQGTNVLQVFNGSVPTNGAAGGLGSRQSITWGDLDAMKSGEISTIKWAVAVLSTRVQVQSDEQNWQTSVVGTTADWFKIRNWEAVKGSIFDEDASQSNAKLCILGTTVANQLFATSDPIGQTVRIQGQPYTVYGVLTSKGAGPQGDMDDLIVIPIKTYQQKLSKGLAKYIPGQIMVSMMTDDQADQTIASVTSLLRDRHKLDTTQDDDFRIRNPADLAKAAQDSAHRISILLAIVAAVSLFVGGIGVMNIMLVSVIERTREIGIRMAVGACPIDVMTLFLVEALALAIVGGALGIGLGYIAAKYGAEYFNFKMFFPASIAALAFGVAGGVGVVFGLYPAIRASQLDPITALRYET